MELNGSEIIIACLKEQGVDTVFGYPGGTILNLYDELYKHPEIHHVLTSHEQGAAHAADGYARATGKVGVCFATSGPGATNLVTGIATANMDSVPMVAITANVSTTALGKDSFQEVDIAGVAMPITKYSTIVKDIHKLADTIRRAFSIAKSGRPGPVLVDVTKDVTAARCEYRKVKPREVRPVVDMITQSDLERAAAMINASKKPYIFVGGGAVKANAENEVRQLAHKIQAPVCDSLMGKGVMPGEDPLYMGMLGMHGTKGANLGVYACDLLIVLGSRFSDRDVGDTRNFARQAKILQIDVDPAEINKNVRVQASVSGDLKVVLEYLLPKIKEKDNPEWLAEMEKKRMLTTDRVSSKKLTGPYIVKEIYRATKGEAIVCTDVGQHQMWAAQYYKYSEPRTLLTSGGLGTMGYGLGAAIGAKFGRPERTVVNIAGDGCFRMNMQELATATRYDIPVIEVVINNHVLGMVRQWQTLFYEKRYSHTTLRDKVNFTKVAEGMGAVAYHVTTPEEFKKAFREAMKANTAVLIDCEIDSDDKVFPMVPAGKANSEVFDEQDLKRRQKA
ncbi:MAG: biosynthetic-type acetolactate synthase large subunit [Eubacterium sp.]|nr:biosynthetic-type acetolactate synthase large subunit [Eubacterium sp.]